MNQFLGFLVLSMFLSSCAGKELRKVESARLAYRECISRSVQDYRASTEKPETVADAALSKCEVERSELELHLAKYRHRKNFQGVGADLDINEIEAQEKKNGIRLVVESRLK